MTVAAPDLVVFVVDDDEAVRDSTRLLLEIHGIKACAYASARDFLEAFDPRATGCIVLDIHMPEMTGVELLSLLRSRGISTPVIVVSGQADFALGEMLTRAGAMAILNKPVNGEDLITLVRQALTMGQS